MIFIATGSRRSGQITLVTPLQTKAKPFLGSTGLVPEAVKLPVRSRAVGTTAPLRNVLVAWRSPEYDMKKKALSCLIGPQGWPRTDCDETAPSPVSSPSHWH